MINDPLLRAAQSTQDDPRQWAPPTQPSLPASAARRAGSLTPSDAGSPRGAAKRKRHPAVSSRILAVGLSTSAMFALTAGYASAERKSVAQPVDGAGTPLTDDPIATAPNQPIAQPDATTPAPAQQRTPQTTPRVVQVPVAPVAPATPSRNGGGNTQQSSGSN